MNLSRLKKIFLFSFIFLAGLTGGRTADKPWKNVAEGSLVSTNGNSKAYTASGKNTYTHQWRKWGLEWIMGALGSKSEGENTAEKYFGTEKGSYKITERNYTFQRYGWDKDRFAGIKNRHDVSVGLGREIYKKPKDSLIVEWGFGQVFEERYNERTNKFASSRIYGKYNYLISDTATFFQIAEYIANFADKADYRVNTETSLLATLTTHLSLKVSYTWNHVGQPPLGRARNDSTTALSLVATY